MRKPSRKKNKGIGQTGDGKSGRKSARAVTQARLSQDAVASRDPKLKYYVASAVAVLTFLVYLPSLGNGFVQWDDDLYVYENAHIRSLGRSFIKWAFWGFHEGHWHPLTWMSHALDYAAWGLNPLGHHLTSTILHAVNTFLVVLLTVLLADIIRKRAPTQGTATFLDNNGTLVAGCITGFLFGLEPVHVESVAWISDRKDLLCTLFFFLSIMTYLGYACRADHEAAPDKPKAVFFLNKRYLFSLGFFILALFSKSMAVTLPVVLLILDWYPLRRVEDLKSFRSAFVEKLPFIACSLAASKLAVLAQAAAGVIGATEAFPLSMRVAVAAGSLVGYLGKMIAPINLIPYYPYPDDVSLFSFKYLSAIVLVLGITTTCVVLGKKQKFLPAAWGYYAVTLLPVIGLVGGQSMADRYAYVPGVGPYLVIGFGAAWISKKMIFGTKRALTAGVLGVSGAIVLLCVLSSLTIKQEGVWKNTFTLWNNVIEKQPEKKIPFAYLGRGLIFDEQGRLDRAFDDYSKAIALVPSYYKAYINRAIVYSKMGQTEKAIADYDKVISLNPYSYEAYNNKGLIYSNAGSFDRAIAQYNSAIGIDPNDPLAYANRGLAYSLLGEPRPAFEDLNRAIELDRNYARAYDIRARLYLKIRDSDRAAQDFQRACSLQYEEACIALKAPEK
jgi:Tfp pilus assembly protein PilF